jgi:hypothetical protein
MLYSSIMKTYLIQIISTKKYFLKHSTKDLSKYIGSQTQLSNGGDFYRVIQEIESI